MRDHCFDNYSSEETDVAKEKQKGPSLSALAALTTLAVALWMEVDLPVAIFRSILVYLVLSLVLMAYRLVVGKILEASQRRAQRELLEKIQKEAEEEQQRNQQREEAQAKRSARRRAEKTSKEPTPENASRPADEVEA